MNRKQTAIDRRWTRYAFSLTIPLAAALSFCMEGTWSFLAIFYAFGALPLLELLLRPNGRNLLPEERSAVETDQRFDRWLWWMIPVQWGMLGWFFWHIPDASLGSVTWWGWVSAMGLLCGVLGINVAHELGHRPGKQFAWGAYALLVTSLYTHFYVEHNRGHHRNVATAEDPASAGRGEWVWVFWLRSWWGGWWHGIQLEATRCRRAGEAPYGWANEVVRWQVVQWAMWGAVAAVAGWGVALGWGVAAVLGGLLLETVNYIEHYGLSRSRSNAHRYERVQPAHSWNSNHPLGRLVLFELSRHSDHHAHPAKPYSELDHLEEAPQLPTGYPGMMLLSWVPPLYFAVVHPKLREQESKRVVSR